MTEPTAQNSLWLRLLTKLHHQPLLRWSNSAVFFSTRGPQIISLLPTIGYVILWSDALQPVFSYTQRLGTQGILAPIIRLYFLYFGSVFVLAAWLVFLFRVPPIIRRHQNAESFIHETIATGNAVQLEIGLGVLNELFAQEKQERWKAMLATNRYVMWETLGKSLRHFNNAGMDHWLSQSYNNLWYSHQILRATYNVHDFGLLTYRTLTLMLLAFGTALFLIPSVEVFLLVVMSLLF